MTVGKQMKTCRFCGEAFEAANNWSVYCSMACKRADEAAKKAEAVKADPWAGKVLCKCPKCEKLHVVRMAPPDNGIMPRKFCPDCGKNISGLRGYDFVSSGDHLAGGLAMAQRTPRIRAMS